ncbi:sn1-specific diacylglycerol lipase alpha [Copidosoma floridanum]|uniref:sn1-specific diacylglycerol lipase alpha n=1 Tax=Copidosoma floridanum TaxID=29053 RepID=UPI000C6F534D|nr:sn1-specific diacylglycerol lipase alpha [Copidosoma floridanum]
MPGIVVFRRRWSVGSDDLVVPGAFLFFLHLVWLIILAVLLYMLEWDLNVQCVLLLWEYVIGYIILFLVSMAIELSMCVLATRGSILNTLARAPMQYVLYARLFFLLVEAALLGAGVTWLTRFYHSCPVHRGKDVMLTLVISNWCVLVLIMITVWCVYDAAGRSWVKMKKYQRSMREAEYRTKAHYKRSGSNRNWRQRKVIRAYQDSWDNRCRILFCCIGKSDRNRNSFADIAQLLSDFFRDLDVVPSDVIAGLVLMRKFQKIERELIVKQRKNDTYEFLSGVPITPRTKFLSLTEDGDLGHFQSAIHYMHFALAAYGWPLFLINQSSGVCHLCTRLRCCCFPCTRRNDDATIVEDNCCLCNYATIRKMVEIGEIEVVYATFHVDVGETPFFVALDYTKKKVVVSIRGTLSMKDVMTDLNADSEALPLTPPREDWLGHKGMVQVAEYIRKKLHDEGIIAKALDKNPSRGTRDFGLVLVGHSLGGGTAAILAILMRQDYPDLECFAYAPPGGLLSMPAQEYSQEFITSVVVGKDVIPRIGLRQMESLRADLLNAIKRSVDPKWKTITCSVMCCGCGAMPTSAANLEAEGSISEYQREKDLARSEAIVSTESCTALTLHRPLYLPGRIIHVVRHHPNKGEQILKKHEPVYQALWADPGDFDEVLISPVMIQDHMPDNMLKALNKVLEHREICAELSATAPVATTIVPTTTTTTTTTTTVTLDVAALERTTTTTNNNRVTATVQPQSPTMDSGTRSHRADWSRLAPLATPETMSESSNSAPPSPLPSCQRPMMRRTPKISGNLSTAADDLKNNIHFAMLSAKNYYSRQERHVNSSASSASSGCAINSEASCSFESTKSMASQQQVALPPVPRRGDSVLVNREHSKPCTSSCCRDDLSDNNSSPNTSSGIPRRVQIDFPEEDNGSSLDFYETKATKDSSNEVFLSVRSSPECKGLMHPATDLGAEWRRNSGKIGEAAPDLSLPLLRGLSPTPQTAANQHHANSPFFNAKRKKYVYPITLVSRGESSV